jgi:SAM-dependent methyltransferase
LNLLVSRPEAARALGERAKNYVATECNWAVVARKYASFLESVSGGTDDRFSSSVTEGLQPAKFEVGHASACQPAERPGVFDTVSLDWQPPPPASVSGGTDDRFSSSVNLAPETPQPAESAPSAELAPYLHGWAHDEEQRWYLNTHETRLVKTLSITPPGGPHDRVLEMGAYLQITPALKTKLGYGEVRGCYYGELGRCDHRTVISTEGEPFECTIDLFDAEKDRFPYPDGHFSTVLCGELIEHLFEDPMHLMSEVNRILKPGGHLVLTTPNIASLRGIAAILQGYHPGLFHSYIKPAESGHVDPRHNREYTPREIHQLLENAGFEVTLLETGGFRDAPHPEYGWVLHLMNRYELDTNLRGDGIFGVGRKTGAVRERYPGWLYT